MKQLITLSLIAVALLATGCNEEKKNDQAAASMDAKSAEPAKDVAPDTKKP